MIRGGFFRKTLLLVYGTVALFAALIVAIYTSVSPQLFARNKIDDLIPKGQIISGYIESTLRGEISTAYLVPLIGRSTSQWEATVWVVDSDGDTLIRTQQSDGRRVGRLPSRLAQAMLPAVLSGQIATHIGDQEDLTPGSSLRTLANSSGVLDGIAGHGEEDTSTEETLSGSIVAVAVPITFFGEVVGAVFMSQSMTEVMSGMQALSDAVTFSVLLIALLLLPVTLYFASRLSRPVADMRAVALTMAGGDRTVRADDKRSDEFGELGGALNYLSSELGSTISSLELERNRLKSLINGLSEGIIALDEHGETTLINPAVHHLLGIDPDADPRASAPQVLDMFDECLRTHDAVRRTIWQSQTALHISVSPLERQDGSLSGCVGILSDVTSAERLEQTRRDYVANVSHELRTPLTAMRALIEPLRDGLIKTEEQRQQTYNIVLRETMRLSRLVSDMLELSRLQSGKASLSRSVFAPRPLLDLIHETYSAYAEDYQQTFIYDVPDALPNVSGNPDRTQQVLVSLLDNALKYTPEGGTVTLRVADCGDVLRISVSDTGIGISREDLPHVFERFYKADKSHGGKGTGLGLAIAYEIMKNLGEEMSVESTLGQGSTFIFTLHTAK
ncbi:MAG: HAMP domain-containing protein [Clostridia bacterium]|nr:HAMP domain-containing protein [Clostridia bacterium]MBQ4609456.1 HAMP domain-containing protein [Clostridia bacterium]MBQ7053568.1 HAMP domain-containing protein [Clostridia bacterium]